MIHVLASIFAVVHALKHQSSIMRLVLAFDFVSAAALAGLISRLWVLRIHQGKGQRPFLPYASLSWLVLVIEGAYADTIILHQHLSFTLPLAIRLVGNIFGLAALLIQTLRPSAV